MTLALVHAARAARHSVIHSAKRSAGRLCWRGARECSTPAASPRTASPPSRRRWLASTELTPKSRPGSKFGSARRRPALRSEFRPAPAESRHAHQAHHIERLRAQGHADADLVGPLRHRVRDHPVNPQRRQQQRHGGKQRQQQGEKTRTRARARPSLHPWCGTARWGGADPARGLRSGWRRTMRHGVALRADHQVGGDETVVTAGRWKFADKECRVRCRWAGRGRHSSCRRPRPRWCAIGPLGRIRAHAMSEGALVGPKGVRHGLVDHRRGRATRPIAGFRKRPSIRRAPIVRK